MPDAQTPVGRRSPARRTIVKGAAWAVPVIAIGAPAAHAGPSSCQYESSITVGPNVRYVNIRAICAADSQKPTNPRVIRQQYGFGELPEYLQICNCQNEPGWFRWKEVDTRSNFQIEVDGEHNDQNSNTGGYRTAFYLESFGDVGGCRQFALTYRASASLPRNSSDSVTIEWRLERSSWNSGNPSNPPTGGWQHLQTFSRTGTVRRYDQSNPNFNSCQSGQRVAEEAPESVSNPTGD